MNNKPGYKMTEIGEIPEDWQVATLKDKKVSKKLQAGGTPLRTIKEYYENGKIPFVRIEDMTRNEHYLDDTDIKITENGLENSSAWLVPPNTILFSMYASYGEVAINKIPVATNQAIIAIMPQENLDIEYLYYSLKQLKSKLYKHLRETTQKNLNAEIVKNLKIPLPPFQEQQKIASVLSHVDEAIQKTDEIIQKTRELKKGLMQQLLTKGIGHTKFKQTDIGEMPEEWEVSTIGQECKVGTGGTPSRRNPNYFRGNIPWVKTTELDYNIITSTEENITEKALKESNARIYPRGTLLIAMYGLEAPGTRGKCAILGIDAAVNQACAAIQSSGRIPILFLFYFYQLLRNRIMSFAGGTKRQNLNLSLMRAVKIPVPSMNEQLKIADIFSEVDYKIHQETQRKEQLDKLKKGLMQDLLTGRVRVKVN